MSKSLRKFSYYFDPHIMGIVFLGFSSGLPFLLTLATLHVWLSELGVNKTTIGLFALMTLPYSLKFLWAPLVDRLPFPIFSAILGHKRGWMFASQLAVSVGLLCMARMDPSANLGYAAALTFLVSFLSATQDVVIESYRVDRLQVHETGYGAGASNLGYRLGMWVSGAGALYIAAVYSWGVAYTVMAACMAVGMCTTLMSREPSNYAQHACAYDRDKSHNIQPIVSWSRALMMSSLRQGLDAFRQKPYIVSGVIYILLFKCLDSGLNVMAAPFLLETGFTTLEIAHVGKSFGIATMIIGGLFGGYLLSSHPLMVTLYLASGLQIFSAMLFYEQHYAGAHLGMLFATIGIENLANGIGAAAFITILTHLARGPNSGTQFALLASFGSFVRVVFSHLSGLMADVLTWPQYYLLIAAIGLAMVIFLVVYMNTFISHAFERAIITPQG